MLTSTFLLLGQLNYYSKIIIMTQLKSIIKWSIVFQLFVAFKTGLCFSNFFYPEINPTYLTPDNNIPLSELKAESRYWNGTWWGTSVTSGSSAVVNKTLLGYGTGFLLASAFFLHTMAYTLENSSSAQSKNSEKTPLNIFVESIFGPRERFHDEDEDDDDDDMGGNRRRSDNKKSKKARKVSADKCDCETYCTNKYYYGDGNYEPNYANSNVDYSTWYNEEDLAATSPAESNRRRRKRGYVIGGLLQRGLILIT